MRAEKLIETAEARGARFSLEGDRVWIDVEDDLPAGLLASLRACKAEVMAVLRERQPFVLALEGWRAKLRCSVCGGPERSKDNPLNRVSYPANGGDAGVRPPPLQAHRDGLRTVS